MMIGGTLPLFVQNTEIGLRARVALFSKRLEQPERSSKIAPLVGCNPVFKWISNGNAAANGHHQAGQQTCDEFPTVDPCLAKKSFKRNVLTP
jgi:hypothetical protein